MRMENSACWERHFSCRAENKSTLNDFGWATLLKSGLTRVKSERFWNNVQMEPENAWIEHMPVHQDWRYPSPISRWMFKSHVGILQHSNRSKTEQYAPNKAISSKTFHLQLSQYYHCTRRNMPQTSAVKHLTWLASSARLTLILVDAHCQARQDDRSGALSFRDRDG